MATLNCTQCMSESLFLMTAASQADDLFRPPMPPSAFSLALSYSLQVFPPRLEDALHSALLPSSTWNTAKGFGDLKLLPLLVKYIQEVHLKLND